MRQVSPQPGIEHDDGSGHEQIPDLSLERASMNQHRHLLTFAQDEEEDDEVESTGEGSECRRRLRLALRVPLTFTLPGLEATAAS